MIISKRSSGFTIVELTVVIIIVTVLALYAVPRFFRSGFAETSLSRQLISRLQLVQNQNMNFASKSFCLQISGSNYFSGEWNGASCILPSWDEAAGFASELSVSQGVVVFDGMGKVDTSQSTLCPVVPCAIQIVGAETQTIRVEAEGYIRVL